MLSLVLKQQNKQLLRITIVAQQVKNLTPEIVSMRVWVQAPASLSRLRICVVASCSVGHRCGSDLALLWLWLAAAAPTPLLAWELIYAVGVALKTKQNKILKTTPEEILGLSQIASHLQPLNHEAPKSYRLRMKVKLVARKGGGCGNWADRTTDVQGEA